MCLIILRYSPENAATRAGGEHEPPRYWYTNMSASHLNSQTPRRSGISLQQMNETSRSLSPNRELKKKWSERRHQLIEAFHESLKHILHTHGKPATHLIRQLNLQAEEEKCRQQNDVFGT